MDSIAGTEFVMRHPAAVVPPTIPGATRWADAAAILPPAHLDPEPYTPEPHAPGPYTVAEPPAPTAAVAAPTPTPAGAPPPAETPAATADQGGFSLFGDDGFTFGDILDIINPLQHIPVISSIYRHFTGDEIAPASRIAGGGLFGGIIGAASSLFNVIVEAFTGRDLGEHVIALFDDTGSGAPQGGGTMVAAADTGPPSPPPPPADWDSTGLIPVPVAVAPLPAPARPDLAAMRHIRVAAAPAANGWQGDIMMQVVGSYRRTAGLAGAPAGTVVNQLF